MEIIKVRNLSKLYKRFEKEQGLGGSIKSLFRRKYSYKEAVSGLDLTIKEGEFIGLIGPNGAGKTTLVKMLTGIIAPTEGTIDVLGYYPNKLQNELKRQYALVMGQKSQLFFELTAADTFMLFKELYGIRDEVYKENLEYFIKLFQIEPLLNVQVRTLSLGERMKLELVVSLLHNPKILFLDEPTIGLDAIAQRQIRSFLKQVNEEKGTTILLTSHYMEDIKSLCQRCVVINHGKKLYDGPTQDLFEKYQERKTISMLYEEGKRPVVPSEVEIVLEKDNRLTLTIDKEKVQATIQDLLKQGHILDFTIEEEDIGVVVEQIYSQEEVIKA